MTALSQDSDGVTVRLEGEAGEAEETCFRYVVGCDGAHSAVRRLPGLAFEGSADPWPFTPGDVRIDWDLPYGMSLRAVRLVEVAPPGLVPAGGTEAASLLVRPDGHAGRRGRSWRDDGLQDHLRRLCPGARARDGIAENLVRHRLVKTADRSAGAGD